jgi:hypothetical protein
LPSSERADRTPYLPRRHRHRHPMLIQTNLSAEEEAKLHEVFADDDD